MNNKPENYDWNKRLITQIKDSIIGLCYRIYVNIKMCGPHDLFHYTPNMPIILVRDFPDDKMSIRVLISINDDDYPLLFGEAPKDIRQHIDHCKDEDDVYWAILSNKHFTEGFDKLLHTIIPGYDDYLNMILKQCMSVDFPYPYYDNEKLKDYFRDIMKNINKYIVSFTYDDIIIKHFHHSIYDTPTKGNVSPSTAWKDPELLMKSIENRSMYKNYHDLNIVADGLNIAKIAPRASLFTIKQSLGLFTSELFKDCKSIIDPMMGFSGKMVASIILGLNYTGIYDIDVLSNMKNVRLKESQTIIEWINKEFPKLSDNILNIKLNEFNDVDKNTSYDVMICEIPYWNEAIMVSNNEVEVSDTWINKLIQTFKCKRYVFLVKDTTKYTDNIYQTLDKHSHLYNYHRKIIVINK